MPSSRLLSLTQLAASASLILLIALCVSWELWLAPLRPGGSLLVLKTFPLLLPLFGVLRGRRYTYQWASMLILAYLAEGLVRWMSDPGISRHYAVIEVLLCSVFFAAALLYARATGQVIKQARLATQATEAASPNDQTSP